MTARLFVIINSVVQTFNECDYYCSVKRVNWKDAAAGALANPPPNVTNPPSAVNLIPISLNCPKTLSLQADLTHIFTFFGNNSIAGFNTSCCWKALIKPVASAASSKLMPHSGSHVICLTQFPEACRELKPTLDNN